MRCLRELTGFVAIALAFECGEASPTVQGGDPTYIDPVKAACSSGGAHSGNRWQDLFYCYFGPTGVATCGGDGSACHGTANSLGVTASGGVVCPPGSDPMPCWQKVNATVGGPGLFGALCKTDSTGHVVGLMPKSPATGGCAYVFTSSDLARIQDWIRQGAPNN